MLNAGNLALVSASGKDADPIYLAIARHRRAFEALRARGCSEDVYGEEAVALRCVLECPATTLDGVRSALDYVADVIDSGWELENGDEDVAFFHRAVERAVERISAARA